MRALLHHHEEDSGQQFMDQIGADSAQDALQLWREKENKLREARSKLEGLQTQLLQNVDRYSPEFDTKIQESFIMLNKKVATLVAEKNVYALFAERPCCNWHVDFWFPEAATLEIRQRKELDRPTLKLLLRQSIWKFLGDALFNRKQPFSAFGGTLPRNMTEMYLELFEDCGIV
jgi:hypothetical protein